MRITTKYTYVYRIIGIIGCLLVLGSLFVPWINITVGEIQDFEEGAAPTGWQLANLEKGGEWDANIFAYLFMIVYVFLILAPIGILIIAIGKDGRGIGYYLTSMSIFFLVLIIFLMPMIQESIPIPEDPYESMTQEQIDALDASTRLKLEEQLEHRDRIINMKMVRMGPAMGIMLTVVGGIVTYIGSRLVARDGERVHNIYAYYILLKEAHKGGRITKEEEDLLTAQRRMHKISREEHESLLKKMFPEERQFQQAVYMHDHPIDMDRMIIEKHLQDYEVFLTQAYSHGKPTDEELQMLEIIRRTIDISMEDHYMILDYLKAEGRIKKRRSRPKKMGTRLAEVPDEVKVPPQEEGPRYVHSWEYKSTITRETPLDPGSPAQGQPPGERPPRDPRKGVPPKPGPAPEGPPKLGEPKGAPPPPKKEPSSKAKPRPEKAPKKRPKRPSRVKCTKCGTKIPVPPGDGPVTIKCPKCGISGKI